MTTYLDFSQNDTSLTSMINLLQPDTHWYYNPIWAAWASQLDDSQIWYVTPKEFDELEKITRVSPSYLSVTIGQTEIMLLGVANPTTVMGQLWNNEFNVDSLFTRWMCVVYNEMKKSDMRQKWEDALFSASEYHKKHRQLVRSIAYLKHVNMDDHNLFKTQPVLYALGYLHHWKSRHNENIYELAKQLIETLTKEYRREYPETQTQKQIRNVATALLEEKHRILTWGDLKLNIDTLTFEKGGMSKKELENIELTLPDIDFGTVIIKSK